MVIQKALRTCEGKQFQICEYCLSQQRLYCKRVYPFVTYHNTISNTYTICPRSHAFLYVGPAMDKSKAAKLRQTTTAVQIRKRRNVKTLNITLATLIKLFFLGVYQWYGFRSVFKFQCNLKTCPSLLPKKAKISSTNATMVTW